MYDYDLAVIGSGPGGYVAAIRAAQIGGKVVLVERGDIGGTCLNRGCIPTKALFHCARVYQLIKEAERFGINVGGAKIDMDRIMEFKGTVVKDLVEGVSRLLASNKVNVILGEACLSADRMVSIKDRDGSQTSIRARNVIIATGSKPQDPPISSKGLQHVISSDEALRLREVPREMLIIGGGVMGIEFACIYAALGAKVRIVKRSPNILPPIDEEISRRLAQVLRKKEVEINTGVYIKDVIEKAPGRKTVIATTREGSPLEYEADVVLSAMGRVPDFGGLDLSRLGIEHGPKGVTVDDAMRTSLEGVYAIGDVVGRYFLAPVASFEGIVAAENAMGQHSTMDYGVVPQCVFSMPEVAGVGLRESEAKAAGIAVAVSRFPFRANGRAVSMAETEGMVKIVANRETHEILGVHILGPHADDLIHEAAIALRLRARAEDVASMIHAHPTLSEALMEAGHGIGGHPIHLARLSV